MHCELPPRDEEIVEHLLLHCSMARELWDMVFTIFGIQWVMPRRVVDLLHCWQDHFGWHQSVEIWKAIPPCLMWCIWNERNARKFEGCERNMLKLKGLFMKSLLEWMTASRMFTFTSLSEFIDFCNYRS